MSTLLRSAALAFLTIAPSIGSVSAAPNMLTGGPKITARATQFSPPFSQTYRPRTPACFSREVLDRTRSAFYDSCTGAFIRPFVS